MNERTARELEGDCEDRASKAKSKRGVKGRVEPLFHQESP